MSSHLGSSACHRPSKKPTLERCQETLFGSSRSRSCNRTGIFTCFGILSSHPLGSYSETICFYKQPCVFKGWFALLLWSTSTVHISSIRFSSPTRKVDLSAYFPFLCCPVSVVWSSSGVSVRESHASSSRGWISVIFMTVELSLCIWRKGTAIPANFLENGGF